MSTCVPTIVLNKHLSERAFKEAKIVFFTFVDKETEGLGILASLALTKVAEHWHWTLNCSGHGKNETTLSQQR